MRKLVVAALTLAVAVPAAEALQRDSRPGIAVLPFTNGGSYGKEQEDYEAMQIGLPQMLITELSAHPRARLVDRQILKQLMDEQDLGQSGRVDPETAAQIGKLVGAQYVIVGGFIDFYGDFRIDARIVSVETGEILKAEQVRDKREKLYDLVGQMAAKVIQDVELPPLRPREAKASPPEQAVSYYLRGLLAADRGDRARARELFSKAIEEFPEYTEASQELKQLGTS